MQLTMDSTTKWTILILSPSILATIFLILTSTYVDSTIVTDLVQVDKIVIRRIAIL